MRLSTEFLEFKVKLQFVHETSLRLLSRKKVISGGRVGDWGGGQGDKHNSF